MEFPRSGTEITQYSTSSRFPHQNKTAGFGQRQRSLHNRYTRTGILFRLGMAVAYSRYKLVTILLLKRLCNGHFISKAAVRRFQKRNRHLDQEVV
jgi:hypothetical protein